MRDFFAWYSARRKDMDLEFDGVHYTYNWENNLSQDFQYAYVTCGSDTWVLLQTHNGVDARCGLADIRVFKLKSDKNDFIPCLDAEVYCAKGHYWQQDGSAVFRTRELYGDLPRRAVREIDGTKRHLGELWMDKDGVLYCPICRARNPLHACCSIH